MALVDDMLAAGVRDAGQRADVEVEGALAPWRIQLRHLWLWHRRRNLRQRRLQLRRPILHSDLGRRVQVHRRRAWYRQGNNQSLLLIPWRHPTL